MCSEIKLCSSLMHVLLSSQVIQSQRSWLWALWLQHLLILAGAFIRGWSSFHTASWSPTTVKRLNYRPPLQSHAAQLLQAWRQTLIILSLSAVSSEMGEGVRLLHSSSKQVRNETKWSMSYSYTQRLQKNEPEMKSKTGTQSCIY